MQLAAGDTLFIDWLCLEGQPRSSYRIVGTEGPHFWYYRVGSMRVLKTTSNSIDFGVRTGELSASVLRGSQEMAQA